MKILAFDPSGSFLEGKGTTGYAAYQDGKLVNVGQICAKDFQSQHEYWDWHLFVIRSFAPDVVVCENYILYEFARNAQIGSMFETPQIIGIISHHCYLNKIRFVLQPAAFKARFTNAVLLHDRIVTQDAQRRYYAIGMPLSQHILDAIRHGEYYLRYKNDEGEEK